MTGHVLVLGCGDSTRPLVDALRARGEAVAVVDDDAGVVRGLRREGITALLGDAADARVLQAAGAGEASVVVSTLRRPQDHAAVVDAAAGRPVVVRAFETDEAAALRDAGGEVVVMSEQMADRFFRWFDARSPGSPAPSA